MLSVRKTKVILSFLILIFSLAGLIATFYLVKKPKKETPSQAATNALGVTVNDSTSTNVHQDKSYLLHFTNPDGSNYNGPLDASLKKTDGTFPLPTPFNDIGNNPLQVIDGNLTINLNNWRNQQTGQWINLGAYIAKFRPHGRDDMELSNEITVNVLPYDIQTFWPFPSPGSYFEYKEIPSIAPTRFRFDIEKNVNICSSLNLSVFRMTQTNRSGQPKRFMGLQSSFRFILEWVGEHLHGFGIKFYDSITEEQINSNPLIPRGKLGQFKSLNIYNTKGYSSKNLPSFYLIPHYLNLNFYNDGVFQRGLVCDDISNNLYSWAMDIRILDQADLSSGTGAGNLMPGDIQIRFIEHDSPNLDVSLNREDWFLRENLGIIRIESSRDKFSEDCVNSQHTNFACWSNPNLPAGALCNCWSRRIHPQNLTDGFELIQSYQPKKLNFVVKESNAKEYQLIPGSFYTIKETTSNYTGFLAEAGNPGKIWQAPDENGNLKDVWLENGEARIYIPSNFPVGIYSGSFRSWIWWSKPTIDPVDNETTSEPVYPSWSDPIKVTVSSIADSGSLYIRTSRSLVQPGESYFLYVVGNGMARTNYNGLLDYKHIFCPTANPTNCLEETGNWENYQIVNGMTEIALPLNFKTGIYKIRLKPRGLETWDWSNEIRINVGITYGLENTADYWVMNDTPKTFTGMNYITNTGFTTVIGFQPSATLCGNTGKTMYFMKDKPDGYWDAYPWATGTNSLNNLLWHAILWQKKSGWHDEYLWVEGDERFTYNPLNPFSSQENFNLNRRSGIIRYDSLDSKFPPYLLSPRWIGNGWGIGNFHQYTILSAPSGEFKFCDLKQNVSAPIRKWVVHGDILNISLPRYQGPALRLKFFEGDPNFTQNPTGQVVREDWYFIKNVGLIIIEAKYFGPSRPRKPCLDDPDCLINETMEQPNLRLVNQNYLGIASLPFKIKFQGIAGQGPDKNVRVILKDPVTKAEKYRFESVAVDSDTGGVYSGTTPEITPGTYEVFIKGPAHLQKNFGSININSGISIQDLSATPLRAGDIAGGSNPDQPDNIVDVSDLGRLIREFGEADKLSDLNNDGFTTIMDFGILATNFKPGVIGDE